MNKHPIETLDPVFRWLDGVIAEHGLETYMVCVWLSPLLSTFWFFSLPVVARTHLFAAQLAETNTMWDVTVLIEAIRKTLKVRDRTAIPI